MAYKSVTAWAVNTARTEHMVCARGEFCEDTKTFRSPTMLLACSEFKDHHWTAIAQFGTSTYDVFTSAEVGAAAVRAVAAEMQLEIASVLLVLEWDLKADDATFPE